MTKENKEKWKKALSFKADDWVWIIIAMAFIIGASVYMHDTKLCKEVLADPCKICEESTGAACIPEIEPEQPSWKMPLNMSERVGV